LFAGEICGEVVFFWAEVGAGEFFQLFGFLLFTGFRFFDLEL
jgi:hypothetical protein